MDGAAGSLVLTAADLVQLTGKRKPSAQARVLEHLGLPYRQRPDKTLVVLRIHVEVTAPRQQQLHQQPEREPRLRLSYEPT